MRFPRSSLLLLGLLVALPAVLRAQGGAELRASAEEALRTAPGGSRIATVLAGAPVAGGELRDGWREVTLEGWISAKSVRPSRHPRYGLEAAGEAVLRREPGGAPLARAMGGMLLRELAREGDWVRVRRTGWVRGSSLAAAPPQEAAAPVSPAAPPAPAGALVLHSAPSGEPVLSLPADAPVEVVERDGEWTRVRVEGWTRSPVRGGAAGAPGPRELREDPGAHQGRTVRWTARFVALRRAEPIRTDFTPGEAYILARDPNGEPGFVYIALTPEQALAARGLLPLQRFTFVARVRAGKSPLMGHPVLELVEIRS